MEKTNRNKKLETDFCECVPWEQIKVRWGKKEYARFVKWMRGQTCLKEGAYLSDIIDYANQRNKGIKNPDVWD